MNNNDNNKKGQVVPIRPGVKTPRPKKGTVTVIPPMTIDHEPTENDPLEYWVDWVGISWKMAVDYILETCEKLVKLRAQTKHGEWGHAVEARLKLSQRSIKMLIDIGECKIFYSQNQKHASDLPASWYTLYMMTKLPEPVLKQKLKAGEINADTQRKDVEAMVKAEKKKSGGGSDGKTRTPVGPWVKAETVLDKLCKQVQAEALAKASFTEVDLDDAETSKEELVKKLEALMANLRDLVKKKSAKIKDPVKIKPKRGRKKLTTTTTEKKENEGEE